MRAASRFALLLGLAATGALVWAPIRTVDAHKGNTSKYTYNDDVFPILRSKCGQCHTDGGAAPMSLMTYKSDGGGAAAWAQSIREMLVAEAMPPWFVDPAGPAVKGSHSLTPKELDTLVTWAAGGTPEGDRNKQPPASAVAHARWSLGEPDLALPLPRPGRLGPGEMEAEADYAISTTLNETQWIRAVDLLPGTPSIVRSATIGVENGPVLAVWEPGEEVVSAPAGAAFRLQARAALRVHVRYKKSYLEEQQTLTDRSVVGLYFTGEPASGASIESVVFDGPVVERQPSTPTAFGGVLAHDGQVVALRTRVDQPYAFMAVTAITATGRQVPLLKLRGVRPEWPRRYWLADPVTLPAGARIEVSGVPGDSDTGPLGAPTNSPLQIALDVVSQPRHPEP